MSGATPILHGRRVLVTENGRKIADVPAMAGADLPGPVPRPAAAARPVGSGDRIDGASPDASPGREAVRPP